MCLTRHWPLPAFVTVVVLLAWGAPAYARAEAQATAAHHKRAATTAERISLYAPRVRRAAVTYLRLRLLELREAGLDRARAVIEHRLSIDDLLAEPSIIPRAVPPKADHPPSPLQPFR